MSPLESPVNDIEEFRQKLLKCDFDVRVFPDVNLSRFKDLINDYHVEFSKYDEVLIYYSGHGIGLKDDQLLLPIDADPISSESLPSVGIRVSDLLKMRARNDQKFIIISDACRDSEFKDLAPNNYRFSGLAIPSNTFIWYSVANGDMTYEDNAADKKKSQFTSCLLKFIDTPFMSISDLAFNVNTLMSNLKGIKSRSKPEVIDKFDNTPFYFKYK